jgi:hypothetical protein
LWWFCNFSLLLQLLVVEAAQWHFLGNQTMRAGAPATSHYLMTIVDDAMCVP